MSDSTQVRYEVDINIRVVVSTTNPVQAQSDALDVLLVAMESGRFRDYIESISATRDV